MFKWIKNHIVGVIAGAAAIAAGVAATGIAKSHKAKKINKEAVAIQQEALERHEKAHGDLEHRLARLGETEKNVLDSFVLFADTIERILDRPDFKMPFLSKNKLVSYKPEELKQLSTGVQTALQSAVGAGVGTLAGLATFGASAVVAAPAMIAAGVVICVRGFGLKKKAIENKKQALKMSESVDEIVAFYSDLGQTSERFHGCMLTVYGKYMQCLDKMRLTLTKKTVWTEFSIEERNNVESTVLLAGLLFRMCKTKMIIRQRSKGTIVEEINKREIVGLQIEAQQTLRQSA